MNKGNFVVVRGGFRALGLNPPLPIVTEIMAKPFTEFIEWIKDGFRDYLGDVPLFTLLGVNIYKKYNINNPSLDADKNAPLSLV